jgi:hypothetical protein
MPGELGEVLSIAQQIAVPEIDRTERSELEV